MRGGTENRHKGAEPAVYRLALASGIKRQTLDQLRLYPDRAAAILAWLDISRTVLGRAPTYRELGQVCGCSTTRALQIVTKLRKAGVVQVTEGIPRSLRRPVRRGIPLLGHCS
jgi:hypothetical protein